MKLPILFLSLAAIAPAAPANLSILSVQKIWDQGLHNAFTDLIRFQEKWFCTFREGAGHASADGKVRVIASADGREWHSTALLEEAGIDLRDPKFSTTPDGRLMIVMGGSVMVNGQYVDRQTRVSFSADGRTWSAPAKILERGDWLWRVTWFKGIAYGVGFKGGGGLRGVKREASFYRSEDGLKWKRVTPLDIPGSSETTVRFLDDGEAIAQSVDMRTTPRATRIGSSKPPYVDWTWQEVAFPIGGPNFLVMPDGSWLACIRHYKSGSGDARTVLATMTRDSVHPFLTFPSGGDNSYAGMVLHENELWVSYYSSHERKTNIYLVRVAVAAR